MHGFGVSPTRRMQSENGGVGLRGTEAFYLVPPERGDGGLKQ